MGFGEKSAALASEATKEDNSMNAGNDARDVPAAMGAVATHPLYVSLSSAIPPPTYPMPMLGASMPLASIHS